MKKWGKMLEMMMNRCNRARDFCQKKEGIIFFFKADRR
jgi:hypothetical protein